MKNQRNTQALQPFVLMQVCSAFFPRYSSGFCCMCFARYRYRRMKNQTNAQARTGTKNSHDCRYVVSPDCNNGKPYDVMLTPDVSLSYLSRDLAPEIQVCDFLVLGIPKKNCIVNDIQE